MQTSDCRDSDLLGNGKNQQKHKHITNKLSIINECNENATIRVLQFRHNILADFRQNGWILPLLTHTSK